MEDFLRKNQTLLTVTAIAGILVGGWLAFGVFGVQTLFVDDKVNEDVPVFTGGEAPSGLASDELSEDMVADMDAAMAELGNEPTEQAHDSMPDMGTGVVVASHDGRFAPRSHPAEGVARVLTDGSPQRFLRFEDFATDNGPDLNVYLSTAAPDAPAGELDDEFIDLGNLKGNVGSQNYEIPENVDLDEYRTVVIWCVRFSVAFGVAELSSS